jgi:hypothetical protein
MAIGCRNTFTFLRRRAFLSKWSLERLRGDGMIYTI